ncbi:uncharacterized protein LOC132295206 [Cornus florida]|uniref:uncharacterized protein LOC132295206 n=1 Tax=Cornus florida TaxID=4283 RepID=UPI002897A59C|nr:uncharacterized protein LOC132295206 [Cornus florida]
MVSSNLMVSLAMVLVLLPLTARADILTPFYDNICNEVECGEGSCAAAPGSPFNFVCNCYDGWKRTRLDNETDLQFLPCVFPSCSVNYSCMPAVPPLPSTPYNLSFFDPCYWMYCGEGTCTKNLTYTHTCQCNAGYYNLKNISAFPCYSDCAIGADCGRLGIKVSSSTSSTPSGDNGKATSFSPGKFHWLAMLVVSLAMITWK